MWRSALGDATRLGVESTGLERRRVHTRESYQSTFVGEAEHITDFGHELRSNDFARTLHLHNHIELRQQRSEAKHLALQGVQRVINGVQAVRCLGDEQIDAV